MPWLARSARHVAGMPQERDYLTRAAEAYRQAVAQYDKAEHVHEAHLLRLNSSKAVKRLGWSPRWGLDETLAQTVGWYKDFYGGRDVRERSLRQIEDYMQPAQISSAPIVSA